MSNEGKIFQTKLHYVLYYVNLGNFFLQPHNFKYLQIVLLLLQLPFYIFGPFSFVDAFLKCKRHGSHIFLAKWVFFFFQKVKGA